MSVPPMIFRWDGEAFHPLRQALADRHYVVGETYQLAEHQERSYASHAHEFAWLHEAWLQLPESIADQFPSPEHLRKRALIDAGWYDEEVVDAGSDDAAERVAALARKLEEFALVVVRGTIVVVRTAKSQSRRAMDRQAFQASKTAIIETVAALIGVSPDALQRNAGKAA